MARVLPFDEWARLDETELRDVWRTWDPEDVRVCVVEEHDRIVDHWVAIRFWHLEGLRLQRPQDFRQLWRLMAETLKALGSRTFWTGAKYEDDVVREMILRRGGQQVPIDHFIVPVQSPTYREAPCRLSH